MTPRSHANLERLNSLPGAEAESELLKCCASECWAQQMIQARPFASCDELLARAEQIWWSLEPADWLEAFHGHPKIGEKKAAAPTSDEAKRWSEAEQSGVNNAATGTLQALADLNREYEKRFGYIFIVCATGKTSDEILRILSARMGNAEGEELRIAAAEQAKITELRLKKLIDS